MEERTSEGINQKSTKELDSVIIRLAGDSGDGIQITGTHLGYESAYAGNDMATLPDFPAEIRAPAGTIAGVSGFQIHFGAQEILTPGDNPDVLVAFNPAALKANLADVKPGGILVLNEDGFTKKNLDKVGYAENPCEDEELSSVYRMFVVPITKLTKEVLVDSGLTAREIERCKNFFALGVLSWMFNRPTDSTKSWIKSKFAKRQEIVNANIAALSGGIAYAAATEIFDVSYTVRPAVLTKGVYRSINGTVALAYGLIAAAQKSNLSFFYGAYPITPASDTLHELAKHKNLDITTFQAEDEIAAICASLGASYAGSLAVTGTSGPGMALKTEALALAVMTELPLVVINVQRAGPSTGLPTKTEQSDLMQALHGRAGEAPLCVLAVSSPNDAFRLAYEACRIAVKYMTPVVLLSDGFISNTSEPWNIPDPKDLPEFNVSHLSKANSLGGEFMPYLRNETTLARPWAIPGTPGLTHRIGGLEKENKSGNVSGDPENHDLMCRLRAEKIQRISAEIPPLKIDGPAKGELVVIGWGSTEGAIREAIKLVRNDGLEVSRVHLHYLNPLPPDLANVMKQFNRVLVAEVNLGQLRSVLREKFLVDAQGFNRITGQPLKVVEMKQAIEDILKAR